MAKTTIPASAKKPQDRKAAVKKFEFTVGEQTFELPSASSAAPNIPTRLVRNALLDKGGEAELALGFAMLDNCGADPEAVNAIYDMPMGEAGVVLSDWMQSDNELPSA